MGIFKNMFAAGLAAILCEVMVFFLFKMLYGIIIAPAHLIIISITMFAFLVNLLNQDNILQKLEENDE